MSVISVTETASSLALVSCAACARHGWVRDGVLLDREEMLVAMRQRVAEAPKPQGGRPRRERGTAEPRTRRRGSGPAPSTAELERDRRVQEMRAMLSGFEVHGS